MVEELIKMFSLIKSLSATVSNFKLNSALFDFIKKNMLFKKSNRKKTSGLKEKLVLSYFPIPKKSPIPIHIWELLRIIGKYREVLGSI
jgi:hypothetical protein